MLRICSPGERHHERHQRADRGGDGDPGEQQRRDLHRRTDARDRVDEQRRDDRAGERGARDDQPPCDRRSAEHDHRDRAEGRSRGHADHRWVRERVPEQPLEQHPGDPEGGPHQDRQGDPRQPELEQDHLGRAIHAVRVTGETELPREHPDRRARRDPHRSDRHSDQHRDHQRDGQHHHRAAVPARAGPRHAVPSASAS